MMKKITSYILVLSFILISIVPTTTVQAASNETLKDYKDKLEELKSSKEENERMTDETANSIDQKRNAITSANNTISNNEQKVEESKTLVAESQEKIKIKTEELKNVINILQYSDMNSDEIYIDYIFDATSITDLMERQAIVEQIVNYTKEQLNSLEELIDENEKLQVKLQEDNETLNASITEYEKQVEELEDYIDSLATIGLGYDEKIEAMQNQIKLFESAGCKDNDKIQTCYYDKNGGSAAFSRPLTKGRVSQAWGNNGHKGIDLAVSKGTNVYAPASGTVLSVAYKQRCGGNIIYIHFKVNGKAYTGEFAHLTSIKVKAGQKVTAGQIIATTGGDSSTFYYDKCTTGAHLHYAIAYGYYLSEGDDGYVKWSTFTANTKATSVYSITKIKNVKGWTWSTR